MRYGRQRLGANHVASLCHETGRCANAKVLIHSRLEDHRRERPECLPLLDDLIYSVTDPSTTRVGQDTPTSKRSRAKFGSASEPSDYVAARQIPGRSLSGFLNRENLVWHLECIEHLSNRFACVGRAYEQVIEAITRDRRSSQICIGENSRTNAASAVPRCWLRKNVFENATF